MGRHRVSHPRKTESGAEVNRFYSLVTVAFLIWVPVHVVRTYGGKWEFGPHGLPVSVLSPDGERYRDGDEIDPLTMTWIRAGVEEQVMGVLLGGLVTVVLTLANALRNLARVVERQEEWAEAKRIEALAYQYRREGRHAEADAAFKRFDAILESHVAELRSKRFTRRIFDKALAQREKQRKAN
jgi:hypothetical protein